MPPDNLNRQSGVGNMSCRSILAKLKSPKSQICEFDRVIRYRDF